MGIFFKLIRLATRLLTNELHFRFHKENEALYDKYDPNQLGIQEFTDSFKEALQKEDIALTYIRKSAETERIAELDNKFDFTFEGMRDYVFSHLKHYLEKTRHAAENLKVVFDKYGNIGKEPYRQELGSSYNLLQDLRNRTEDIEIINLGPWMDAHEAAANELADLLDKRTSETAKKTDLRMKEARQEVDMVYQQITDRIDAMINLHGKDFVPEFYNEYNAHATEYKVKLAQHLGRVQAGKKDDEKDDENIINE
jgi:hypothetical protein